MSVDRERMDTQPLFKQNPGSLGALSPLGFEQTFFLADLLQGFGVGLIIGAAANVLLTDEQLDAVITGGATIHLFILL